MTGGHDPDPFEDRTEEAEEFEVTLRRAYWAMNAALADQPDYIQCGTVRKLEDILETIERQVPGVREELGE